MGMAPYKMVCCEAGYLPLELEHRHYCAIKPLNFDLKEAGEKLLLDTHALDELRFQKRSLKVLACLKKRLRCDAIKKSDPRISCRR